MSLQDPIADMLTRIRNAHMRNHLSVQVSASIVTEQIAAVMKEEGYIDAYSRGEGAEQRQMLIKLRYVDGRPGIREIRRMSRPRLRRYYKSSEIPRIRGGLGIIVVSTNKGIISSRKAREQGVGGEALCSIF